MRAKTSKNSLCTDSTDFRPANNVTQIKVVSPQYNNEVAVCPSEKSLFYAVVSIMLHAHTFPQAPPAPFLKLTFSTPTLSLPSASVFSW